MPLLNTRLFRDEFFEECYQTRKWVQVFAADCYFGVVAMLLNALSHT